MVVNGCLLDEAYGEYNKKEKKKKNKKEYYDIDHSFKVSNGVHPDDNEDVNFYPVDKNYYNPERKNVINENSEEINQKKTYNTDENSEYNRLLMDKNYQDYLNFQRNRHNYIHQKDIIETFSSVNDNFNDVLIFALFGFIFLIFTDYIYKLGKKSY
jgi:hypothetical protein